ncbi:ATP-binding protein [Streptomyces sp. MNU103]|nr:ATP-binding protein [Streptomyces sp. MNU103]
MALSACAAVLFTVRSSGMRPNGALWAVLCGATAVALAGIVIAAVAAERAARAVHDRVGVLRRSTARREADLRALVEALRNGEPPPPRGRRTERGGDGDEFDQLAGDLARAHDGAVTAVVQAAQLSSQAGSEQKLEVFVNLARRLQSLVHREISILDELENEMEDPDLLKGLFHVDHLATRIRRHAENLAVLGGAVSRRQWSNPVPMTEVLRSAIAEVEQYSRVKLVPPVDGTLRGHAVADVIHLLAELVENATVFSAPHTQVLLRANLVTSGLAVEVEDRGLGMPVGEQDRMNALLADPDQVHVASLLADGRIGLFVVSQLARRHGIHVRLQSNIYGGVQAVLVVPQSLLGGEPAAVTGAPGTTAVLPPADGGTAPTGRHIPALTGPVDTRPDTQPQALVTDAQTEENTTPRPPHPRRPPRPDPGRVPGNGAVPRRCLCAEPAPPAPRPPRPCPASTTPRRTPGTPRPTDPPRRAGRAGPPRPGRRPPRSSPARPRCAARWADPNCPGAAPRSTSRLSCATGPRPARTASTSPATTPS